MSVRRPEGQKGSVLTPLDVLPILVAGRAEPCATSADRGRWSVNADAHVGQQRHPTPKHGIGVGWIERHDASSDHQRHSTSAGIFNNFQLGPAG